MCVGKITCRIAVVLLLTATSVSFAQPAGRSERRAVRQLSERFQSAPEIGETLPDVTLYDAEGDKLNLRDLKGSYSVFVFGCLT